MSVLSVICVKTSVVVVVVVVTVRTTIRTVVSMMVMMVASESVASTTIVASAEVASVSSPRVREGLGVWLCFRVRVRQRVGHGLHHQQCSQGHGHHQ